MSPRGGFVVPPNMGIPSTLMVRNLPAKITPAELLSWLTLRGFKGLFDFLYLPVDINSRASLGYFFINFPSPEHLNNFSRMFHNAIFPYLQTRKTCQICLAKVQGLEANVKCFSNSTTVSKLSDSFKPIVLLDGKYVSFPDTRCRLPSPFAMTVPSAMI